MMRPQTIRDVEQVDDEDFSQSPTEVGAPADAMNLYKMRGVN